MTYPNMEEKIEHIDTEIIEKEDNEDKIVITKPFSPSDIRLQTPPMNLGDIIDMIHYNYIDFGAEYQREQNLWTDQQQSRLIESILLGLRLPAFYFEEVTKKQWRIIDGLQRCCSIRNFCIDNTLNLVDLEFLTQYNGDNFSNFSFDLKRDIRMLPVTVNVLEAGTPDDVKYILYKRLNTGGIKLTPQEIRNAVYIGKAIDIIKEMSEYSEFLDATLHKIPTRRKQSMDFISRFVAFYLVGYENYVVDDLDNFLNESMAAIKEGKYDKEIPKMKSNFKKAMKLSQNIFKEDAFRKRINISDPRNPLNKAYFEVISVAFSKLNDTQRDKLLSSKKEFKIKLIDEMNSNRAYANSFSGGTAKKESVRKRFKTFNTILNEFIK